MTKRVFFSFNYEDVKNFRVNVVRNHGLTKEVGLAGFFDASIWEDAELHGDNSVKKLINSNLENTSVTCVLIGSETWKRRWVRYEIMKSFDRGNTLVGIHVNSIPDKNNQTFFQGLNPFTFLGFYVDQYGNVNDYQEHFGKEWSVYQDLKPSLKNLNNEFRNKGFKLSEWVPCYDWIAQNGYENFASWINNAK